MNRCVISRMTKPLAALGVAVGAILASQPAHAAMLIEMKFNETGTTAANTATGQYEAGGSGGALTSIDDGSMRGNGSLGTLNDQHSADGTGLSGLAGDRAFNPVGGAVLNNVPGGSSLGWTGPDFTISGWLKTNTATPWGGGADGIAQNLLYALSGGGNQFRLREGATENAPDLYVASTTPGGNSTYASVPGIWDATQEWVFWAVTFEGSAGSDTARAKFYAGSTSATASLVASADGVARTHYIHDAFIWGNDTDLAKSIDGLLDNLRFHDEALSLSGVESLRAGDIPEPASMGLLALGVTLISLRRRG